MRWRSPWVRLGISGMLGITAWAGWASFQQYERSVRIQQEIDVLKHEAERVARENETLSQKIQYFASPDFKEGEAKEKLGLKRQEEQVVAIDGDVQLVPEPEPQAVDTIERVGWQTPNYRKWWNRFFNYGAQ